jgi:bifunctional non-homologous end joining protein LigD
MLASIAERPFDSNEWIYEVKWDGYRVMAEIKNDSIQLYSRNDLVLNRKFLPIVVSLEKMSLGTCIIDGEVVALDPKGLSSFSMLQEYIRTGKGKVVYYVFDILFFNGFDLRKVNLLYRKKALEVLIDDKNLETLKINNIRVSGHIEKDGIDFYNVAAKNNLEGIIAKRKESKYESGKRSKDWLKIKIRLLQEVVLCGYTRVDKEKDEIKSLITGIFKDGNLIFSGLVGGGLDQREKSYLMEKMAGIKSKTSPFKEPIKIRSNIQWVKPSTVIQVEFTEWTSSQVMRHPVYKGIRIDKDPEDAVYEAAHERTPVKKKENLKVDDGIKDNIKHSALNDSKTSEDIFGIRLTNPKKIFWPEEKITKGELFEYYKKISPYILPYIIDRLQSLNRCPDGIYGECFYQKDIGVDLPQGLKTKKIFSGSKNKYTNYLECTGIESLLYMINLGCIDIHPWHSRTKSIDRPDFAILDLDPLDTGFDEVKKVAIVSKEVLDRMGVKAFCKTSGSKGLHIYIPLGAKYSYEQSLSFVRIIANKINKLTPQNTSLERMPAKRRGKVYLDCYQNKLGATAAAPYCVRPKKGATVSTPLFWDELSESLKPSDFKLKNLFPRLERTGDIWNGVLGAGIDMAESIEKIENI